MPENNREARRRHFLLVADKDCAVDMPALRAILGTSALSFASEERLARFLKLEKGAVTPLGGLNDQGRAVEVLFEAGVAKKPVLGVHPGDNRATAFLAFADLETLIRAHGNRVSFVRL